MVQWNLLLLTGSLVVGTLMPAPAQITFVPDTSRVIHATGRASSSAEPDTATVSLGVWVADADAKRAKAAADAAVAKIVSLAQTLGVGDNDLKTAAVNIEPRYDTDNPTRLRGYEVTRSVIIVLRDLPALDALLDGAVLAGANRDFDIRLTSSRSDELKRDATLRALADARTQAETAADQLGVRVVGVRSIDLRGDASRQSSASYAVSTYSSAKFLPGMIQLDVEISVVFMIDDRP
jgi:uncharacterized protein YggE